MNTFPLSRSANGVFRPPAHSALLVPFNPAQCKSALPAALAVCAKAAAHSDCHEDFMASPPSLHTPPLLPPACPDRVTGPRYAFLSLLLLCLLISAGCVKVPKEDPAAKYRTNMEETMPVPYTPRDDGVPLTPAELQAFKTVSELDRNLSAEDARIVELHFKYFVHQKRATFERFLERTARFLPYIKKVFDERGIPADIAYLAMVESGGNPNAISPAGAVGLWQFMPFTGKKFGLSQDSWVDERRDPYKATYAASDYLLKLYNDFSKWNLAVAAYNAGEGKIGRAVNGTGASDFFELCRLDCQLEESARLKTETRDYVPRLIAIAKIMRNLRRLGFSEPSPGMAWDLTPITVPPGTNLSGLARQIDLTWDEFSGMNPAYRRTASPPASSSTAYVPPNKMAEAVRWLASSEARTYAGWKEYQVRKGDSLASIAKRNKVSVAAIREANGFSALPKPGSTILLPGGGQKVEPVYAALPETASSASASAGAYTVRSGDTLFSLAQQWGTDVNSIRLANRMGKKDALKPGTRISIPGNSKSKPATVSPAPIKGSANTPGGQANMPRPSYTVRSGDTIGSIAKSCGVSVSALCAANGLDRNKPKLRTGQKLSIPAKPGSDTGGKPSVKASEDAGTERSNQPATAKPLSSNQPAAAKPASSGQPAKGAPERSTPAKPQGGRVTVKAGDTLYSIARANNVSPQALLKANNLDNNAKIKPGQKLVLP